MSIESDVRALATDDGRGVGTEGHRVARKYIYSRLSTLGVEPYLPQGFEAEYQCEGQDFCNLLAIVSGRDRSLAPVLLGGHYDTCGDIPGADDNAAAVAVLLDVAARLAGRPPVRSVVFAFFDAEEPPHFLSSSMGSVRFYEDQRVGDIHCAVILDLVGHDVPVPGLEDLLFVTGMESNQELGEVIESCPVDSAIRILPILNSYVGDMSDHHVFRINKVPYIFLSCGIWPHYHQYSDTPEKLNYGKVDSISNYLERITEAISSKGLFGEFEGYDSTGIEIGFIQSVLLPVVARMGVSLNVETRQDIDWLVGMMRDRFGI